MGISKLKLCAGIAVLATCLGADSQPLTWFWSNPLPFGNDVLNTTLYNGSTVAITDSGQLYTSMDLNAWYPQDTGTTNSLLGVTLFGSRLVCVGQNGVIVYSDDGVSFTSTNLSTPNGDWFEAVAASSNLLVAVGDEAIIYTSKDGAWWTRDSIENEPPGVGGNWLTGAAFGNGLFVTVGEGAYVATSVDGLNWTQRSAPSGFSDDLNWVSWVNTPASSNGFATPGFIAVSDSGKAISSADGTNWTLLLDRSSVTNGLFGVAGTGGSRLLAGDNLLFLENSPGSFTNQIAASISQTNQAQAWTYYTAIAETNNYLIAGAEGYASLGIPDPLTGSYDWSTLAPTNFANPASDGTYGNDYVRSWLWHVSTAPGFYVAVGNQATVLTSDDGVNWAIENVYTNRAAALAAATNTAFFGVGGSSNLLVAVGNAGTIVWSTNNLVTISNVNVVYSNVSALGVLWNTNAPVTTNDLQGVTFFDNQLFVSGGNGTILKSSNAQNWTAVSSGTTHYLSSLEVFSNTIVAVGDAGTILTSSDGNTWTSRTSGVTNWIFRVRKVGDVLVAVGENGTILTSANATTWTEHDSGTTNWLNDAVMVTNEYFILGNYGTVLTSTNATDWSPIPVPTQNSLYGAACRYGQLIAVGLGGTILRSQVVPFTTPVNFYSQPGGALGFAQAGGKNVFFVAGTTNAQGVMAINQQFTLDSSPDLVNWTTGSLLQTDSSGTLLFYVNAPTNCSLYYRTHLVLPQ